MCNGFLCNYSFAVAKGRSLFGDPASEIQDLTQVIKQDLAKLNTDIASLQQQVKARSGRDSRHMSSHSNTVVVSLQVGVPVGDDNFDQA